jgi:hypothetical protein
MIHVTYAHDLVEAVVLEAEPMLTAAGRQAFRDARNAVYQMLDADAREAAFRELHQEWFAKLRLHERVETVLNWQCELGSRVAQCRVLRAFRFKDEGADLFDVVASRKADRQPLLVIRLRPSRLLEGESLSMFLTRELMHVLDMLDPRFGYRRTLPVSDCGPSADTLVRNRYRVVWDVTIDGRLARGGAVRPAVRESRIEEFATAFPMLGDQMRHHFDNWFDRIEPTHDRIVEFAMHPPASRSSGGRCPICRFPAAALDPAPERMSAAARHRIELEHQEWHIDQGLCSQCLDLYEAHHGTNE